MKSLKEPLDNGTDTAKMQADVAKEALRNKSDPRQKGATAPTANAASAPGVWSIVNSPNASPLREDYLNGVACASASQCWAVGYDFDPSNQSSQTLIEKWDGASWSIVTSPGASDSVLKGVSCVSASECWAVGFYSNNTSNGTLIERWDGNSWTITPSPNTALHANSLSGVACVSANECWAVGDAFDSSSQLSQTLIEKWDGASWSIVASPANNSGFDTHLSKVTCAAANQCWAVGYYYSNNSNSNRTLIEKWDGASWSIVVSPNSSPSEDNALSGVTCASPNQCWAVGYHGNAKHTLIEKWDGVSWSVAASPDSSSSEDNALSGVTCASANECWAVGYYRNVTQTLIEKWDGASWSIVASPDTSSSDYNSLAEVACASSKECWSVGSYGLNTNGTLIERYTPLDIASVTHPAANTIRLLCVGVPNAVNRIEFSTDLSGNSFTTLASPLANAAGTFSYDDTNAGIKKFYRVTYP